MFHLHYSSKGWLSFLLSLVRFSEALLCLVKELKARDILTIHFKLLGAKWSNTRNTFRFLLVIFLPNQSSWIPSAHILRTSLIRWWIVIFIVCYILNINFICLLEHIKFFKIQIWEGNGIKILYSLTRSQNWDESTSLGPVEYPLYLLYWILLVSPFLCLLYFRWVSLRFVLCYFLGSPYFNFILFSLMLSCILLVVFVWYIIIFVMLNAFLLLGIATMSYLAIYMEN